MVSNYGYIGLFLVVAILFTVTTLLLPVSLRFLKIIPKKPDPAGIRHVVAKLGAVPATTIMVGDSATDLRTARAAGLAGIVLVSYGYTTIPAHALGADLVLDSLEALPEALRALRITPPPRELTLK